MTRFALALFALAHLFAATAPAAEPQVDALGDPLPPDAILRLGTARFSHGTAIEATVVTPDGKTVVVAGGSVLRAWDAATGRLRFAATDVRLPHAAVPGAYLTISPDGRLLACGCRDSSVRFWDLTTGRELPPASARMGKEPAVAVSFTPDAKHLLVGHDWAQGYLLGMINDVPMDERERGRANFVRGGPWVHVSRDGRIWMLAKDEFDGKQNIVSFEHLISETNRREVILPAKATAIAVSPDGKSVAVALRNMRTRLYDAVTGWERHVLSTAKPMWGQRGTTALAFSSDSAMVATGSDDGWLTVWNTNSGMKRFEIALGGHAVTVIAFSSD